MQNLVHLNEEQLPLNTVLTKQLGSKRNAIIDEAHQNKNQLLKSHETGVSYLPTTSFPHKKPQITIACEKFSEKTNFEKLLHFLTTKRT